MQSLYGDGAPSDTVRAFCEERLRSAVANGTISWEDFERRLDATYTVDTLAELDELVRSLPEPIDLPAKTVTSRHRIRVGAAVMAVALCAAMILIAFIVRSPSPRTSSPSVHSTASTTHATTGDGPVGWAYQHLPQGYTVISGGSSDDPMSCTRGTTFCVAVVSTTTATVTGLVPLADVVTTGGKTWRGYRGIPAAFAVAEGISCPTASACMMVGQGQADDGPEIAVSDDGGQSWSLVAPPVLSSTWLLNAVDCVSASVCWVAGTEGSDPEIPLVMESTDWGQRWTVFSNLPDPDDSALSAISCNSTTTCVAVGNTTATSPQATSPQAAVVVRTSDAGQTWTAPSSPVLENSGALMSVSCPDAAHCFAVGSVQNGGALVLGSSDGGQTWVSRALSIDNGWLNSIDCPTRDNCWAAGTATTLALVGTANAGAAWAAFPDNHTSTSGGTVSCPTVDRCWVTQENGLWATTNDGDLEQAVIADLRSKSVTVPLVNAGPGRVNLIVENYIGDGSARLDVRAASGRLVKNAVVPHGFSQLTVALRPGAYRIVANGSSAGSFVLPTSAPQAGEALAPRTTTMPAKASSTTTGTRANQPNSGVAPTKSPARNIDSTTITGAPLGYTAVQTNQSYAAEIVVQHTGTLRGVSVPVSYSFCNQGECPGPWQLSALSVSVYSDVNNLPAAELTEVEIAPTSVPELGGMSVITAHFPQAQPVSAGEALFVVLSLARPSGEMRYNWYNYYGPEAQTTAQSSGTGSLWRPMVVAQYGVGFSRMGVAALVNR